MYTKRTQITRGGLNLTQVGTIVDSDNYSCLRAVGIGRKILPFSTGTTPALLPTHLQTTG